MTKYVLNNILEDSIDGIISFGDGTWEENWFDDIGKVTEGSAKNDEIDGKLDEKGIVSRLDDLMEEIIHSAFDGVVKNKY